MAAPLMSSAQRRTTAGYRWSLTEGAALKLPLDRRARWLLVTDGRVWLTQSAADGGAAVGDCWLEPGDSVLLRAGSEAVVEGWPSARFELLQPAPGSAVSASLFALWRAALRRLGRRWKAEWALTPTPCARG